MFVLSTKNPKISLVSNRPPNLSSLIFLENSLLLMLDNYYKEKVEGIFHFINYRNVGND